MKNRIINSTILLFVAYFLVHFLSNLVQYFFLKIFNVPKLVMYFFYNSYEMPINTWWTKVKVFLVSGSATIVSSLIFLLVLILILNISRKKHKLKIFYYWLLIVSSSFVLSSFIAAPFFRESVSVYNVLRWLNFESDGGGIYAIAILMLPLIPIIAYYINKPFIAMANTTRWLRTKKDRVLFYLKVTFVPLIILSLVISVMVFFIYNYPLINAIAAEGTRLFVMASILGFGAFFSFNKKYISIQKSNDTHFVETSFVLLVIVVIIAYYILLWFNLF